MQNLAAEKGFLKEPYRIFYLKDKMTGEMDYHYHTFNKIIIFLSGEASYVIEGRKYKFSPWDVVFVKHHTVHKPDVNLSQAYERIVIFIDDGFLETNSDGIDLSSCFNLAEQTKSNVLRPDAGLRFEISKLCDNMRRELRHNALGSKLVLNCNLISLLVLLNRYFNNDGQLHVKYKTDPKIEMVLEYINENISEALSVDDLCKLCFMSRYHFMRRFKEISGYTVHNYIIVKRLTFAAELMRKGVTPTEAAHLCGFSDYSSFLRSFKKVYELTPQKFAKEKA